MILLQFRGYWFLRTFKYAVLNIVYSDILDEIVYKK